ncbi:hypothetical protein ACIGKQ_10880 [Gordonia sp. NPDC062954]|uniref:hypothetical protein n=1 Tax=Gordonia sp. NPDC062954 TaxID=3364003 RepID=UPI0037C9946D
MTTGSDVPADPPNPSSRKDSSAVPALRKKSRSPNQQRPSTIEGLVEYAYKQGDKKLDLTQASMHGIELKQGRETAEIEQINRLSANDLLLNVPPKLLASLAALGAQPSVQKRLIQLITVALAQHPIFDGRQEILISASMPSDFSTSELVERVNDVAPQDIGLTDEAAFTATMKDRLKSNAVTAYALLCVLQGKWRTAQFIEAMSSTVWTRPLQPSVQKAAALLASSKALDELSQLTAHHSSIHRRAQHELDFSTAESTELRRQSAESERKVSVLSAELEKSKEQLASSAMQIADLNNKLAEERSSRNVDYSHAVDDFEHLRTRVLRRLSSQVELLTDGLHAVRNNRIPVAEEFVERALDAIKSEVNTLKDLGEGE